MKAGCTCLCACGFFPPAEAGLPIAAWEKAFSSEGTCIFPLGSGWRFPWRDFGQDALASLNSITQFHADFRRLRENPVGPRAKLDQAHALPTRQLFTRLVVEYDTPRQQAGNLLEDNGYSIAFH